MRKLLNSTIFIMVLGIICGPAFANPYLVYNSGGSQYHLEEAMTMLGFSYDVRSAADPVTAADLATHEALIIGWSASGYDMSGLDPAILTAGITGNKILTGHDADYHTWAGNAAAATFMERAVLFAGAAAGAGILAFPVYDTDPFSYLPAAWGISSFDSLTSENIDAVTAAGDASGLYAGLTTADLSDWGESFHAGFTGWDPSFSAFEVGSPPTGTYVTIGTTVTPVVIDTPEPASLALLGLGLLGLGLRRRQKV